MNEQANAITTLTPGQEIRVKGFTLAQRITVNTITGYATKNGEEPAKAIARAVEFGHPLTPWTLQESAALTDNYPGKQAELDAKVAATAAAPEIEDGQTVEIEGVFYIVKVLGQRFSDPVAFRQA